MHVSNGHRVLRRFLYEAYDILCFSIQSYPVGVTGRRRLAAGSCYRLPYVVSFILYARSPQQLLGQIWIFQATTEAGKPYVSAGLLQKPAPGHQVE